MKTVSYHAINAPESDYLYIAASQIPLAGNGLFTAIDIYKDEMAAVYKGRLLSDSQAEEKCARGLDRYFLTLPNGTILDAMPVESFAKYANDAAGYPNGAFKNNTKLAFDEDNVVGLIALRPIKAGEELFCSYGKAYWARHR